MSEFKALVISLHGSPIEVVLPSTNLYDRFVERTCHHPNKIAVVLEDQSLTYGELFSWVNSLACRLSRIVQPGDVVCQCVERSIEMVVGILGIFMCNTVYCPLSPYDPDLRRRTLLSETHTKVILVHKATADLFVDNDRVFVVRIDQDDSSDLLFIDRPMKDLSTIAFIVFTSGSIGIPKGVPIGHTNFAYYLASMCHERYILESDILLQVSRDTFDAHIQEILGAVLVGGTCVLLCSNSGTHLNIAYLIKIMRDHHVTYINLVPSLSIALIDHLRGSKQLCSSFLRVAVSTGEALPRILAGELLECLGSHTQLLNTYGVTETTLDCTYRRVCDADVLPSASTVFIPIGLPLPNYVCHIMVEEGEQGDGIGELYIGGPGVFRGYLNHPANPADSRLIEIDNKMCYHTGDLVKIVNGELVYVGRRDFQVKIRGQRIETAEIEATILRECRKQLNACLVVAKEDHLIAYVQTRGPDLIVDQQIKEVCSQHLPSSMNLFAVVVLDRFPLNANGKIDRARLPTPESHVTAFSVNDAPETDLELELKTVWCRLLKMDNIPRDVNLLTLGANSLHFMLAINHYCRQWLSNQPQVDLSIFFQRATISQHVQLLAVHAQTNHTTTTVSRCLSPHLTEAPASFEQEAIWLDEQMRFQSSNDGVAVYHIVLAFRLQPIHDKSQLVTSRLRSSLQLLVEKHTSLRTWLQISDENLSELCQRTLPSSSCEVPLVESWIDSDNDLYNIIADEETNRSHFNLGQDHVFRCHVVRYRGKNHGSIIIFNFHHSAFDGTSEALFLDDLCEAYSTGKLTNLTHEVFTYLDYARWERQLDMSASLAFWKNHLKDHQILELPYDRVCPRTVRTGRGSSVFVYHGDALVAYARQRQVTLFQLCLATYYAFLYKLIGSLDLMVGSLVANRTRPELSSMIGMFANMIPYRFEIDPHETFRQLIERVQSLCHSVLPHLRLPFQTLSKLLHSTEGIATTLDFETVITQYSLDENLQLSRMTTPVNMTLFDLSLSFKHDLSTNTLTAAFDYSPDVFYPRTVEILADRFQLLLAQLLTDDQRPLYGFTILLDHERQLLQDFNPATPALEFEPCHWTFTRRADEHPQKIGIVMEGQSLSYSEILHYTQQWAMYLRTTCHVNVGDIVLQVLERSIHTVLGVFAMWMCGAVYTPFNPRDSPTQLQSRIHSLEAHVVLVHDATRSFFTLDYDIVIVDLDRIPLEQHNDVSELDSISVVSDHLSHIVFTSGSTGEPKAIQLCHRNFVSYIRSYVINSTSVVLQHTSVSFDPHLEEIAGSLISSAQLVILKPDPCHLDMDYLLTTIARHHVTFLGTVPTTLIMLTDMLRSLSQVYQDSRLRSLRCIVSGGEKLYLTTVLDLVPFLNFECVVRNYYGPAECAVASTCYVVTGKESQNRIGLPIGRPLAHAQIYILDEHLQEVVPDQMGEIVIGGAGVFIGYRNQDELTRQVLVEYNGSRCYRTGDFGRLNAQSGQLEFLGRRDHQVKIRGQRIELDGIEQVILRFDVKISNSLVLKVSLASGDHLVAYVQHNDDEHSINDSKIRSFCQEHLPSFMIPSFFIVLEQFPLNHTGKVDRSRLPQPTVGIIPNRQNEVLSSLEQNLCTIFAEAFELPNSTSLNVEATFAELGATSLGIVKALGLIRRQQLNDSHPVDISILLANPSVRLLAQALDSSFSHGNVSAAVPSETGFVHASSSIDGRFDEDSTSRSLLVETLGILLLIYVFAVPIYLGLRLTLIVAPMLHLLLYIVFKRLFMLSTTNDCCQIYSLVYYRWWFLRRLWKLNEPWLYMIQGTSLYNSYLRLCGARIGVDVNLRTSLIDLPDLLEIGDNSLVGEDVVLSSMTYESEKAFRLTSIHIGARCRIGARSVLHSKVHIGDQVFAKPLTPMAGNIVDNLVVNGYEQVRRFETYEVLNEAPVSMFNSSLGVCAVWLIHECLLRVALVCSQSYWPLTCLIWLLGCISILLITLKWLPSSIESWWIRQLLVTAFGFAIPLTFEGDGIEATEHIYPRLVRWLGRSSIGQNVRSGTITNLLTIRRHLLDVGMNVMLGADIFFDDGNGIIRIGDGASLGNDCLIQADAHIPPSASVGSMTRVDSSPGFTQSNQVIIGIPARQTMLFAPVRPIDNVFQRNVISYLIIKLIFIRFLSLLLIFSIMHITILPMSIIVFSLIVCILYSLKFDSSLMSHLTLTLVNDFNLFVGPFIGGTQWLNIVLNALGATIHRTAIIADIDCINDPRLIRISSHVRIDQRARVQAHTYEYRQLYLRPVSIGTRSQLMPNAFVLPGCHLDGNNRIYPCTLIMKGDKLPMNTDWQGSPARHCHPSLSFRQ